MVRLAHSRCICSRKGRVLSKNSVGMILKNPLYAGWITIKGQSHQGQHEPIRSGEVQSRIREILKGNDRRNGSGRCRAVKQGYGFANGYGMGSLGGRNPERIKPAHADHAYGREFT